MTLLPLVGREWELAVLDDLVARVGEFGGAMVVRGEAGIGKSALLDAVRTRAKEQGMTVLTTVGVESEAHLPFAGLHQLLRPTLRQAESLPARQRAALLAAFGMADAAAPDRFLIALAALELFADTASGSPLLVIVEDAQWLDRPTSDVLAFVARRLESEPIVLLVGLRDGHASSGASYVEFADASHVGGIIRYAGRFTKFIERAVKSNNPLRACSRLVACP